jgi:CubicO group peptidase (beta-lactamase class C family)
LAVGCETRASLTKKRVRAVEKGLLRAVFLKGQKLEKFALNARMPFYRVPGVAVAVMDRNAIEWSREYGVCDLRTGEPVAQNTVFQVGALGQPVTAAAVLELVKDGKLDIDTDVNARLHSWRVPRNALAEKSNITLRSLLTHTAGFPISPLPGYSRDRTAPSLIDLLNGRDAASALALTPDAPPGQEVRPSEIGFAVLQQIVADTASEPFPTFVKERIFGPLGMKFSTFAMPIPETGGNRPATGHTRDGKAIEGKWLNYPGDGLWTNPSEFLSFAAAVMQTAMGSGQHLLSAELARSMLTRQFGNAGFGFAIDGQGTDIRIHLRGHTRGYTGSLDIYPYKGQGAVIMTNSDNGIFITEEILRAMAAAYEWPDFKPVEHAVYRLDPSNYRTYIGRYQVMPDYFLDVTFEDYYLVVRPTGQAPTKFYVESQTFFFSVDPYIRIQFLSDDRGRVNGLILWQQDFKQEAKKIS